MLSDLISRQAVIDALRTCYDTEAVTYTNGNEYISYDQALELVEKLPSAQPDPCELPIKEKCAYCPHCYNCDVNDDLSIREPEPCEDAISRQAAIDALNSINGTAELDEAFFMIENLPSAQPEPFSDAYMKAVWTWLLNYQIKVAELKGRYTPYEVLSWVANDWRKEHGQAVSE